MKNRTFSLVLLLHLHLFLLLSSIITTAKADVITLTADTFSDKDKDSLQLLGAANGPFPLLVLVQEKDTAWFVQFCVPWCKHCKNLGTLWEDLGRAMEGEDEIEIGKVDCSTSASVCKKVDIHSYPTFKLFYEGEEVLKYQGKRDVESLKAFVLEEAEKAATQAQLDKDEL